MTFIAAHASSFASAATRQDVVVIIVIVVVVSTLIVVVVAVRFAYQTRPAADVGHGHVVVHAECRCEL